jgi:DSF synthase
MAMSISLVSERQSVGSDLLRHGHDKITRFEPFLQRQARDASRSGTDGASGLDLHALNADFEQLSIDFEADAGILWCYQEHGERPCFSPDLLREVLDLQTRLQRSFCSTGARTLPLRYVVWASSTPGIFNLGGDLRLFTQLIRAGDANGLFNYGRACVDICYLNTISLDLPILTVALVQGDALGGGFEAVLSNDLVVAEHGSQFGLPEILFNLFPGMGAYSFLSRRLDGARARELIMSGRLYSAEELHEMGLVDLLVPAGRGEAALREHLHGQSQRHAVHSALSRIARRCRPVTYEELIDVVHIWVETALGLTETDLRRMERLAGAQERRRARARELADGAATFSAAV